MTYYYATHWHNNKQLMVAIHSRYVAPSVAAWRVLLCCGLSCCFRWLW